VSKSDKHQNELHERISIPERKLGSETEAGTQDDTDEEDSHNDDDGDNSINFD
jgi:hypothetical protein